MFKSHLHSKMQTLAGGEVLTAEMTLKNSVLLDVAVALVRIQKPIQNLHAYILS